MPYTNISQHGEYLIDVKPHPLRDSTEWTTHIAIYRDFKDAVGPIKNVHMGNRCGSEEDAYEAGLKEAKRIIEEW